MSSIQIAANTEDLVGGAADNELEKVGCEAPSGSAANEKRNAWEGMEVPSARGCSQACRTLCRQQKGSARWVGGHKHKLLLRIATFGDLLRWCLLHCLRLASKRRGFPAPASLVCWSKIRSEMGMNPRIPSQRLKERFV